MLGSDQRDIDYERVWRSHLEKVAHKKQLKGAGMSFCVCVCTHSSKITWMGQQHMRTAAAEPCRCCVPVYAHRSCGFGCAPGTAAAWHMHQHRTVCVILHLSPRCPCRRPHLTRAVILLPLIKQPAVVVTVVVCCRLVPQRAGGGVCGEHQGCSSCRCQGHRQPPAAEVGQGVSPQLECCTAMQPLEPLRPSCALAPATTLAHTCLVLIAALAGSFHVMSAHRECRLPPPSALLDTR